jgi:carbonic anhydrase/acetyltransferase-like protein (isoleucine patch superfamily)
MAMLHGCTVGEGSLVGIAAVVLNGAKIGKNCLIGAKAFVREGMEVADGSMVLGIPGKVVRQMSDEQIAGINRTAFSYQENWRNFAKNGKLVG